LPVVSAMIAILVLGERPNRSLLLAIGLAATGIFAITFRTGGGHSLVGNALVFGAVISEGLFILLNKRLRVPVSPLVLSTLMTGLGFALAIIPALMEAPWTQPMPTGALAAVAYYALVPTVGGFLLWYMGSARVSGAEASLFTALAPVSAVLFAATFLGEPVGPPQLIGIGCVLAAVLTTGISQKALAR
jgi:drug/metabolite transporter (DMT)-like permease